LATFAPEVDKGFNDFEFEVWRRKSVVMLNSDMDDKLAAKPTDSHGLDVGVGNFSFDSTE
jgi:hypothetical protein